MTNSLNLNCTYYYRFCEITSMMLDITELKTQNQLISNFIKLTMSQVAKLKSVYNTFIPKGILISWNRWKGCKDDEHRVDVSFQAISVYISSTDLFGCQPSTKIFNFLCDKRTWTEQNMKRWGKFWTHFCTKNLLKFLFELN